MPLTNYVLMPGADYQAACDAIRAKTGKSELLKSGELAAEIAAIETGGGSMEGVHIVTFMSEDGSTVLYERPVADGDNCADVIARGLLATQTKESTAQYSYTQSGWSLTPGGAANASALTNVTEDRVVYAAFTSAVRYYTVTYYDSDGVTVLKTESLAYGATPAYVPEKSGYSFNGWTPALAAVTGDASYQAAWEEKITFKNGAWEDIVAIVDSGQAEEYFSVGDYRNHTSADGSTFTMQIIGFNHDNLADGSGKAHMTLAVFNLFADKFSIPSWTQLAEDMKTALNPQIPEEIRSVIKPVYKECDTDTFGETVNVVFELFPFSFNELKITKSNKTELKSNVFTTLGQPYKACEDNHNPTYGVPYITGISQFYNNIARNSAWLRQTWHDGVNKPCYAMYYINSTSGSTVWYADSTTTYKVSAGFCI